jgi:Uncharacterized conserved protein (DUF2358)
MDILTTLRQDYANFPDNQSYQIYDENVYFQDPLTRFRGLDRYRKTIGFIKTWFKQPQLELYEIDRVVGTAAPLEHRLITTRWSLSWNTPLPWYPRIEITGRSEMLLNDRELIISHIDYWDCTPFDVLKQHFATQS